MLWIPSKTLPRHDSLFLSLPLFRVCLLYSPEWFKTQIYIRGERHSQEQGKTRWPISRLPKRQSQKLRAEKGRCGKFMRQKPTALLTSRNEQPWRIRGGSYVETPGRSAEPRTGLRFIGHGTIYLTRLNAYFIALVDGTHSHIRIYVYTYIQTHSVSTSVGPILVSAPRRFCAPSIGRDF